MPDPQIAAPLDLASLDLGSEPAAARLVPAVVPSMPMADDPRLAPQPPAGRLVEIGSLGPDEREAAERSAASLDFARTTTLLAHGDGALAGIAQSSRQLLAGVRLGDAGEVGRIAAAVLDGVKLLRVEDLQAEAAGRSAAAPGGWLGRLGRLAVGARSAFQGFAESRRRFLDLMDTEQAKARRIRADLEVTVELLDQQASAIRQSLHALKIEIAAGQIALDRGEAELEHRRLEAVRTGDPADAADVLERRGALANFRGKVAEMRENLVGSALLIPIVSENRKAAETRIMQISNGMLVVIPRLMAVASQAAVQVDIRHAAEEAGRLGEAAREITRLASIGAHEAATAAARSLGGDARDIDVLAEVAEQAVRTMREVIEIEHAVAAAEAARETRLVEIRERLAGGMRGMADHAVAR